MSIPLGICIFPKAPPNAARMVSYEEVVFEILQHAGLYHKAVTPEQLASALPTLRILVTVGCGDLPDGFEEWLHSGGAWLAVGDVCGRPDLLGVQCEKPAISVFAGGSVTLGEGYSMPGPDPDPITNTDGVPLHFFGGIAVRTNGADLLAGVFDAHARQTDRSSVSRFAAGRGTAMLIAPDLTGTVVRIRQGTAVTRDGIPAPDGTVPTMDGVLKSDDGAALDWILDRYPVTGVPGFQAFLHPIADMWCEVLLRAIFDLADRTRTMLPLLWFYPRRLPAVAHLSHDTDLNDPDLARRMLEVVGDLGLASTWCTILPGYEPDLMRAIRDAGHELAMHFDAMTTGRSWSEQEFNAQWTALTDLFDGAPPVSNKNHYLRWEGDTEFYGWLERRGIRLDQSKGASKTGEAGYNFGTCHTFVPVDPDGTPRDVLVMATPTQDPEVFAPRELAGALLKTVLRHHGILHLLFHPAHIRKPGVEEELRASVASARQNGMEWWTARQIDAWERARRSISWSDAENGIVLCVEDNLPDATLVWVSPGGTMHIDGCQMSPQIFPAWGRNLPSITLDLAPGQYVLEVVP